MLLTSNNAREMSDALKRRCMHLYIDFPSNELELEIIRLKVPEVGAKLIGTRSSGSCTRSCASST